MAQATVTIENRTIPLQARLAEIVRLLIRYEQVICTPEVCTVEFQCSKHSAGAPGGVKARLVVPLGRTD